MSIEAKVKSILQKALDIKPGEIVPGAKLDESLGIDSTEMVEISVAIKKEFGIPLKDNELKKSQSLVEIVKLLESKLETADEDSGSCGPSRGCGH